MAVSGWKPCLAGLLVSLALQAQTERTWEGGIQVAWLSPTSSDLKRTTGGSGTAFGLHGNRLLGGTFLIRPRLEFGRFSEGHQRALVQGLEQQLTTEVSTLALGVDGLWVLPVDWPRFSLGVGIQQIRWQVKSTNTVTTGQGGMASHSGSTSWWRLGIGPVVSWRLSEALELEGRMTYSQYGQENQPAQTTAVALLWHF